MSSVVIAGDTSGTITIAAPAVSGTNTLTLPANTGTVLTTASTFGGTGPAFSAYQSSSQTLSGSTDTKITFTTEEFDTNNNFASSTFTPTVAGYYQVNSSIRVNTTTTSIRMMIYKNGSKYKIGTDIATTCNNGFVSTLVYCNGTTDYIEAYANIGVGQALSASSSDTWFNGAMIRSA